jgi:hypothetical protein
MSSPDRIDTIAICYLAAPVALWALTWLVFPLNVLAGIAVVVAAVPFIWPARSPLTFSALAVALAMGFAATFISGSSPLVESIPILDLGKLRWVYSDLVTQPWPVIYESNEFLRYSIGAYLVPAAVTKIVGGTGNTILYLWFALGASIFAAFAIERAKSPAWLFVPFAVAALWFSGLDIVGTTIRWPWQRLSEITAHEGWARSPHGWLFTSGGNAIGSTPSHGISGWIAGGLLYRNWDKPWFVRHSVGLFAVLLLWSPFVAAAFAVIVAGTCLFRSAAFRELFSVPNALAVIPGTALFIYLSVATTGIRKHVTLLVTPLSQSEYWLSYALVVVVEFLAIAAVAVWAKRPTPPLLAAILLLLILPLFHVGNGTNDVTLSGARVSLAILTLFVLDAIVQSQSRKRYALTLLVVVALYTGIGETIGVLRAPRIHEDWTKSIASFDQRFRIQYVAPREGLVTAILRQR